MCLIPNLKFLYFATVIGESCCGGLCLFGPHIYFDTSLFIFFPVCIEFCPISSRFVFYPCCLILPVMPDLSHTMPESDKDIRDQIETVFSFHPCLLQIHVVCAIL